MAILQIPTEKFQKIIRASRSAIYGIKDAFLKNGQFKEESLEILMRFETFIRTWSRREFEFLYKKTIDRTFSDLQLAQPIKQFDVPEETINNISAKLLDQSLYAEPNGFIPIAVKAIETVRTRIALMRSSNEFSPSLFDIESHADELVFSFDHFIARKGGMKSRQISTIGQRVACLRAGHGLIQISSILGRRDDACNLYAGRVFALIKAESERYGIPMIDELPGRGAPFHVGCEHAERPFFPYLCSQAALNRLLTPPPTWALNTTWKQVMTEYRNHGGRAFAEEQNPNLYYAAKSRAQSFRRNTRNFQDRMVTISRKRAP